MSQSEPAANLTRSASKEACAHRGDLLRVEQCPSCRGHVSVKVFACELHRHCTLARPLPDCACCARCPDFTAPAPAEPEAPSP